MDLKLKIKYVKIIQNQSFCKKADDISERSNWKGMLYLAFCDDDRQYLNKVIPLIVDEFSKAHQKVDCSIFTSGDELIEVFKIRKPNFDVIFLDIEMPGKDGKVVARLLRKCDKSFKLIFISSHEQEALNMFQYDVIAFLPKNKLDSYLREAIERLVQIIEEDRPQMQYLKTKQSAIDDTYVEIKVPLNDIKYFESVNRKVYMHTTKGLFQIFKHQFSDIIERYEKLGFIDIHRTCIVNPKYISRINETEVWIDEDERLMLSRRKRKKVLEQFATGILEDL